MRKMDLADRYLNSICTKRMLQAGRLRIVLIRTHACSYASSTTFVSDPVSST